MKGRMMIGLIAGLAVTTSTTARLVPFENCYPYQRALKDGSSVCMTSLNEKHHLRVTASRHHCLLISGERVLKRVPKLMQADRHNAKKQLAKIASQT